MTTASAVVTWQLERPPPTTAVSVSIGEKALNVSSSEGTTATGATASTASYGVFAAAGGGTVSSADTTGTSLRLAGLENGTTYDVWVVAYSEAANPSDASALVAGTPQPVYDFYELYRAEGGAEACGEGPAAGRLRPHRPSSPPQAPPVGAPARPCRDFSSRPRVILRLLWVRG